jgi:hypothetical protein
MSYKDANAESPFPLFESAVSDFSASRSFFPDFSYPEGQDLSRITELFKELTNSSTPVIPCLSAISLELESLKCAPIHPILRSLDFADFAREAMLSTLNPVTICAFADCVSLATRTDPVVLKDFQSHQPFVFNLANVLESVGSLTIVSVVPLFRDLISCYDEDMFCLLLKLFDRRYKTNELCAGYAGAFAKMAEFVVDFEQARDFIPVFEMLVARNIWQFTLDGILALTRIEYLGDRADVLARFVMKDDLKTVTICESLCGKLPLIPDEYLCTALKIIYACFEAHIGCSPSIGNDLDLEFLLAIEDDEAISIAVEVFCVGMRSGDMRDRAVQDGHLMDLLTILEERPFRARMSAGTALSRILNDLDRDQLAELADAGLFEHLLACLENNDTPKLVREILLGFQRLVRLVPSSAPFVIERWNSFEPFMESEDRAISAYTYLLKNAVSYPDV